MRRSVITVILAGAVTTVERSGRSNPATTPTTAATSVPDGTWRGLTVAPEDRCSPYDAEGGYSYPQSVEEDIVRELAATPDGARSAMFRSSTTPSATSRRRPLDDEGSPPAPR